MSKISGDGRTIAVLSLALAGFAAPATAAPDSATLLKGLAACQGVAQGQARLGCFDDLARRSLGGATVQQPTTSAAPPAPSAAMVPTPPASPALPQSTAMASPAPSPSPDPTPQIPKGSSALDKLIGKSDKVTVTIAKVETGRDDALRLTTTEGTVFDQLDENRSFDPPKAGNQVTIERRLFGYRCHISKQVFFTCKPKDS